MRCSKCGFANRDGVRFCEECGGGMEAPCARCGATVPPGRKFCGACGAAVAPLAPLAPAVRAPPGERRQVTVMFADLAGFTRLSRDRDPEQVHALLNRFFATTDAIVQRYGGSVDKHIGDAVMALFGAPVAHGNDPERAVRAALDIQQAVGRLDEALHVHIGVASGEVVASGTGSDAHQQYTVTGNVVNLAARLQDLAGAGETLMSDGAWRAVAPVALCEPLPRTAIKGFDAPATVWRLIGLRQGEAAGRRPFVGRRRELRQFAGILEDCRDSGTGQTVYIRGEAGIGKTRLAEEFEAIARREGFACHAGLVLDFGVGKGQDAISALVRSLLELPAGSDGAARRTAAERAVSAGLLDPDRRVCLNDFLDLPQPAGLRAMYDAMDNAARQAGRQETVCELVRRISARGPLLIEIEDIHWADAPVLTQLSALSAAVAESPALLVLTSRIEGDPLDPAWRAAARNSPLTTIDLAPFRKEEALALAARYIDASSRVALACVERAEGNPLFLEQLLRSAQESADDSIPGSVQSLILARMDMLAAPDRQALQAASVIGQRFAPDLLRHLVGDERCDCAELVKRHLVRPDGEHYLFVNALVREGVYSSLLKARRRELHRRAADWFAGRDATLRAEHLDRAEDPAAPRAHLEAARGQAAEYRYERALQLAGRGLALGGGDAAFALTCVRGDMLRELGTADEAIAVFGQALDIAADDAERCQACLGLAAAMRIVDRYDEALAALDQAEAAARRCGLTAALAQIHYLRGNLYFPLGQIDGCLEQHELALHHARAAGSAELEALALGGLGDAYYARGRIVTAHRYFRQCVELSREHGLPGIEAANLSMVGVTREFQNELAEAMADYSAAVEKAARLGHRRAELIARGQLVFLHRDQGEHAASEAEAKDTLALGRRLGTRRFEGLLLTWIGLAAAAQGRRAEAIELLEQGVSRCVEFGAYNVAACLGALASITDDPERRRRALAEGERILAGRAISHNHFWFYRFAIDAALDDGDWDSAERYAAALEDYTRPEPLPLIDFFIAHGRVLAAYGRGARGEATMRELRRLRGEAERIGLKVALPALDAALAAA